ncbi:MAG: hypothetical protein HY906_14880 [Deltaproteobacteria bacterium]|nr:hypothetical protein [Deltaproteobacteria bacterium]
MEKRQSSGPWDPTTLRWRVRERGGTTTVEFSGELNEDTDFGDLGRVLRGSVVFDLAEVRRINSYGVRAWLAFVRELPAVSALVLARCSPAFVMQLNLVRNLRHGAHVRSFLAPYVCERCGHEEAKLLDVAALPREGGLPPPRQFRCGQCGAPMELDDIPDRYFAFLDGDGEEARRPR